jgi:hypothetical protein
LILANKKADKRINGVIHIQLDVYYFFFYGANNIFRLVRVVKECLTIRASAGITKRVPRNWQQYEDGVAEAWIDYVTQVKEKGTCESWFEI